MNRWCLWLALAGLAGCRGRPVDTGAGSDLSRLVDSLRPAVERAAGLRFKRPPRAEIRTREQVRTYVVHQLEEALPGHKVEGLEAAYRLLGLLPDTLELRRLMLDLFTEQIAGYYEPDSTTLFAVAGADPAQLRVVLAHELVHALQHQYTPVDSLMHHPLDNDHNTAAQAILEGQATLVGLQVMVPTQNVTAMPEFWETFREQIRQQQSSMPVFKQAPRIIREGLVFPYLAGADFMRWWAGSEHRDTVPFGRLMPTSTEQVLHPSRYGRGDQPLLIHFKEPGDSASNYEDVLGEFEIRVLTAELSGAPEVTTAVPIGWGGDRFRVELNKGGPALTWYTAWDDSASAEQFQQHTANLLARRRRLGYRMEVKRMDLSGHPAVRILLAPSAWSGWSHAPEAEVEAPHAEGH
ncbi:MAG TPA: hypothetical protein VJN95_13700 [Gemmatimonadales bacterium]|nr:hypothetical protein [Gemmatimonadales bacterium]